MSKLKFLKDKVLNSLDIRGYYSEALGPLKENGRGEVKTLCCFHSETEPSLFVNTQNGLWHCFGCKAGGSVFDFHMRRYGVDFKVALVELARRAGVL